MRTKSAAETERLAFRLAQGLPAAVRVVALRGDLGAGKTAFTRGFAAGLGYAGVVSSPTYAIVNEYGGKLFHFDWYRLSGADELYDLGWEEYTERGLCVVEWSERAPEALPPETLTVTLTVIDENTREIEW
ncbi:tRNA (adenosine(37)-N6)-threonylcarbamoyltransferase complex ATPase subunit type 1 TsaE [Clostridia bacterium]|nr:tRNA (adenosine(37)-N6)-threonylcarbamoyltransferase complex ATPase subunit type 1 TsaE [Clostridia bacterium]